MKRSSESLLSLHSCVLALISLAAVGGCPLDQTAFDAPAAGDPNSSSTSQISTGQFAGANVVTLDADGKAQLTGRISDAGDVVYFQLRNLATGDRVVANVQSGAFDPVAALFDADQNVHAFNDDREPDASNLNPLLDVVVFGFGGDYFLGITPFPNSGRVGAFTVDVAVTRGANAARSEGQVVYLNWAGGSNIVVPNVGSFDLPRFSATDVGGSESQTERLKDEIQAIVRDRYDGFDMTVTNSDDNSRPTAAHSTVHFGGFNRSAFAISEQIDAQNQDPSDDAIVFTESFRGAFSETPTFSEMATAIGNTTAHEIGHLLGLVHTNECSSLMDTRCGNDSLLVEQSFMRARLDRSVFPAGYQDAQELLGWILGFAGV